MENSQQTATPALIPGSTHTVKLANIRRDPNFVSLYANNVVVESTAFDMKLVFGVIDLRNPLDPAVDQQAGVNLSWPEVKLLLYWMKVHLAAHEGENGKVKLPASVLPGEIPPNPPPPFDNAKGREAFELMRRMRAEFIASLSE
jgi:hypothetical protein